MGYRVIAVLVSIDCSVQVKSPARQAIKRITGGAREASLRGLFRSYSASFTDCVENFFPSLYYISPPCIPTYKMAALDSDGSEAYLTNSDTSITTDSESPGRTEFSSGTIEVVPSIRSRLGELFSENVTAKLLKTAADGLVDNVCYL